MHAARKGKKPPLAALLRWHRTHGRHELPWRRGEDLPQHQDLHPYGVLVSEFMLQQTTVATVEPRFAGWMRLFPTIVSLAAATEEAVLAAWQGLGYYSRARRLHAAACTIMARHGGKIPNTREELLSLPGIGEYTAAAILAFAYDKPSVVLDTNITRVIARWSNLHLPIDTAEGKQSLESTARSFFPGAGSRAIATALMDLGAMICTARTPRCAACPLQPTCRTTAPELLPRKSPRPVTTKRREDRAWFLQNDRLFLELSEGPLWRGLWILPLLGANQPAGKSVAEITYPITRYRVTMKVFPVKGAPPKHLKGFTPEELKEIALPSPHRKAIQRAEQVKA